MRLDEDDHEELQGIADEVMLNFSDITRRAIKFALKHRDKWAPKPL